MEDVAMGTFDLSPLHRSTVGFDRLFEMIDQSLRVEPVGWPPYNIEKMSGERYRITMAVAGFGPEDIEISQHENMLQVTGQKKGTEDNSEYLHRGIANRAFRQTFSIADHVKVTGADLVNGMLHLDLVREVPEALKPRRIEIKTAATLSQDNTKQIEAKAA
jgi:molecular chaperone IbpA